jgi:general secretion pathway protein G
MARFRQQRGFTLLELIMVVAILGLLTSILMPNLLDALQKARQKRAMTDIRGMGMGWLSWQTDQDGAASAGQHVFNQKNLADVSFATMLTFLRPSETFFYVQELPRFDPWGAPYKFRQSQSNLTTSVFICCAARDHLFTQCDAPQIPVGVYRNTDYDRDIIWADGFFVAWPQGGSQNGS